MELREIVQKHGLTFDSQDSLYSGCVDGEEKYSQFMDDLKAIGITFMIFTSSVKDSTQVLFRLKSKVQGRGGLSSMMPYDGRPFQILKMSYLKCAQGGFRCPKRKTSSVSGADSCKKRLPKTTKKATNCPAIMNVRCLRVFMEDCYKSKSLAYKHGTFGDRTISQKLKKALRQAHPPVSILRYYIVMSSAEQHNHTTDAAKITSIIHPRLTEEIHNFVASNICSTKTMKLHLEEVVKRMFEDEGRPKPDKLNRCYYPKDQTIRNHLHKALCKIKEKKYDQDGLEACILRWKTEFPDDWFAFRPYGSEGNSIDKDPACSTLLFCHQTEWQRKLLTQYGDGILLLDAAYKTTKYDLPLFFIAVLTESGYCIVGTIVVQRESSTLLAEALSQFKAWHPDWQPKYFLTHYSDSEVNALQNSFPETTVYLCAFHREQSWHRWLTNTRNVSKEAVAPLKKWWRVIAESKTYVECIENIAKMSKDPFYEASRNAQEYFTKEWLPQTNRWVPAYQTEDFLEKVNTVDYESRSKILRHTYLKNTRDSTLTGLVRTIIKYYLPNLLGLLVNPDCNSMLHSDYKPYTPDQDHMYVQTTSAIHTIVNDISDDGDFILSTFSDEELETNNHEPVPIKDEDTEVRRNLQQTLKLIESYSYMDLTSENLKKFHDMSLQMLDTVRSLVSK